MAFVKHKMAKDKNFSDAYFNAVQIILNNDYARQTD